MYKQLGIVFTGGEGPGPETLKALANDLSVDGAGEGPLIVAPGVAAKTLLVAADSGLALAEAAGLRPDWIVGDMDSLDSGNRLGDYPKERVICYPVDKDYTDTEIALALLWEKGCESAWIVGGGGGRIDHLFGIHGLFERERYPCRWITANEDIRCVDGGDAENNRLKLALKPSALVSVFPLGVGPWQARSGGLKWPLDNARWERGLYGLSNTAMIEEVEISVRQGRFMVILEGYVSNYN